MAGETINLQRFIPKFLLTLFSRNSLYNNTYLLGQRGPIWIPVAEPKELYNSIPELRAVIDRNSAMFANMRIYKRNKATKEIIEDPELDTLLNNPNVTQDQNQFLKQYRSQFLCYGNAFTYKNAIKSKGYPVSLWNISAFYMQPVLTGKLFNQVSMDDIIEKYKFINTLAISVKGVGDVNYNVSSFETSEILFTRIPDLDNPIIGKSPISCLKYPLSNIEQAYKAQNVAMQHIGVGIIAPKVQKDAMGVVKPTPEEKEDMERQFGDDYGIEYHQRKTILSKTAVEWQSMATPTIDLQLNETTKANLAIICNVFNTNPQIFITDTTYENLRSALVQTYQDSIIPAADEFMFALSPFIGLKPNEELYASFEHVSILKENKLKGLEGLNQLIVALTQAVTGGILAASAATKILETELNLSSESY